VDRQDVPDIVREAYSRVAASDERCCCSCSSCGTDVEALAEGMGYSAEELAAAPTEANLGLGCGNPTALAALQPGEVVLDLGAGPGLDCFLAARQVGPTGRVIGVDMTPEMVSRARATAREHGFANVEFRLGEIEHLPAADGTVDVVISNCVINLSADKAQVLREAFRVLKPGGRAAISDIALQQELPARLRESVQAYVGCVAGAILLDEYRALLAAAGFRDIRIATSAASACIRPDTEDPLCRAILEALQPGETVDDYVVSASIEARK